MSTDQISVGNGRHCHMSRASAPVAASTNVVRSTDRGTARVHNRLKPGRAMTLCWVAKTASSVALNRGVAIDSARPSRTDCNIRIGIAGSTAATSRRTTGASVSGSGCVRTNIVMPVTDVPGQGKFFIFQYPGSPPMGCWQQTGPRN